MTRHIPLDRHPFQSPRTPPGDKPLNSTPPKQTQLRRLPWTATTGQTLAGAAPAGHAPLPPLAADDANALTRALMVGLGPMEIRTFEVALAVKGRENGDEVEAEAVPGVRAGVDGLREEEKGAWMMME